MSFDDDEIGNASSEKNALWDNHSAFFLFLESTSSTSTPSSQDPMASDFRSSNLVTAGLNLTDASESTVPSLDLCLEFVVEHDMLGAIGPVNLS